MRARTRPINGDTLRGVRSLTIVLALVVVAGCRSREPAKPACTTKLLALRLPADWATDWACGSYRALYGELEALEGDILQHVHLETSSRASSSSNGQFHGDLEKLVEASMKNDVSATAAALGGALGKCQGCHSEFRF
jgi:hypothetical protein